jgi:tetratricopeptide (TPR) repeat protein
MKLTPAILASTLAAFVSGCSPAVSVRPLYTDADLKKPILEPRVEGEWISPEPDKAGTDEEKPLRWKINPPKQPEYYAAYSVELRVKSDRDKGETVTRYDARLVSIEDKLFFDATVDEYVEGQVNLRPGEPLGFAPTHVVGRIWVQQDFLRIALLNSEWVEHNSPETFQESVTLDKYSDVSIITAPTSELRKFLLKNSDNYEAMAYIYYLCRRGSECALRGFEEELRRRPADKETLEGAAEFFLKRGNFERALDLQRRRAGLEPKDPFRRADIGEALLFKRDFAGARREFTAAERMSPGESSAGEDILWSYFLEGAYADAETAAKGYAPSERHISANPILLSYFSLLRLNRRADAESFLSEQADKFKGPLDEHAFLLDAQRRLTNSGISTSPPENENARRKLFFSALELIGRGDTKWAKTILENAIAKAPNDSLIALAAKIELERLPPPPTK